MNIRDLINVIDEQAGVRARVKSDGKGGWVDADTGQPEKNLVGFANPNTQAAGTPAAGNQPAPTVTNTPPKATTEFDPVQTIGQQAGRKEKPQDAPSKYSQAWNATKKHAPGLARGAANLATGTTKFAGDLAAQTLGGLGQAATAGLGGLVRGYKTARAGQQFGFNKNDPMTQQASAAGSAEVDDLKQMIARIDARLNKANIPERSEKR
jgi:hypothetical protein